MTYPSAAPTSTVPPSSATPPSAPPAVPAPPADTEEGLTENQRRGIIIGIVVAIILVVAASIAAAIWLANNPSQAAALRDVFIIFMALEFMFIGVALVVLMVQLAVLTNMIRHEIRPILQSTSETLNTVRGTTAFLSDNLVDPVIKLNAALAAITQVLDSLSVFGRFGRRK